ncbi:MAG: flap endonuclease [Candidatus Dormibacteraeota bacterium]|nr:flap endonuclease [Candidatus Dormibacteraeota bacterium]
MFIDGSSLIFRAFYGVPSSVRAPDGRQVNAVRGFLETMARLLTSRVPRHIAVATDVDWRPAWRVELLPGYKAHRTAEPIPPLLIPQMGVIEELLTAIGVDVIGLAEYEAEDVIATWTAKTQGTVEIASGDRDLFALVEQGRVIVLYPEKSGLAEIDEHEVQRRYGIPGRTYGDFAVLRGDPSDGLPGLKGVGPVAAAGLIRTYGGIAGLLERGTLSETQRDYLERAMRLVPPVESLSIELPAGRRNLYPVDKNAAAALGAEHGIPATVTRLVEALNRTLVKPSGAPRPNRSRG